MCIFVKESTAKPLCLDSGLRKSLVILWFEDSSAKPKLDKMLLNLLVSYCKRYLLMNK